MMNSFSQLSNSEHRGASYAASVDEVLSAHLPYLGELSDNTRRYLSVIVPSLESLLRPCDTARSEYGRRTFRSGDGQSRVVVEYHTELHYGDDAAIGMAMVRGYIYATRSAELEWIGRLMARNAALTFGALIYLERASIESGDTAFCEGVDLIRRSATIKHRVCSLKVQSLGVASSPRISGRIDRGNGFDIRDKNRPQRWSTLLDITIPPTLRAR